MIALIEDHDEALGIWRKNGFKGISLVHIDAHIDFGFYPAKPIDKIFSEARTLKELKRGLECSLVFRRYQRDLGKQTNIGNYIYPAMQEGIVKDFYWVVPGGLKEFQESANSINNTLRNLLRVRVQGSGFREKEGAVQTRLLGRKLVICILEKLPILKQQTLLDIDTDFLVIDSILNADNTKNIGKRKPWILPADLVNVLKKKIRHPKIITIAYSVNGGYTPLIYKHLGDQIAYHYAPEKFRRRFKNNSDAAYYFNLFSSTHKKKYYQRAVRLNQGYRVTDNNYGPLYLSLRKFSSAKREFKKILRVDKTHSGAIFGLGEIALQKKDFQKARRCFCSVLASRNRKLFTKVKKESLFGLARAEFWLKNFKRAKALLARYQAIEPLQAESYYLLGRILEEEKDFTSSAKFYQDAIRLGFGGMRLISRLLKIALRLKEKTDMIKFVAARHKNFKKGFLRIKRLCLRRQMKIRGLRNTEEEINKIGRKLNTIIKEEMGNARL